MEALIGALVGFLIVAVVAGAVVYVVSMFKLGIEVKNFGWAMIVGVVIGILTSIINYILAIFVSVDSSGLIGAVVHALVTGTAIYAAGAMFKDNFKVDGYSGAVLAAVAMGVIGFVISLIV